MNCRMRTWFLLATIGCMGACSHTSKPIEVQTPEFITKGVFNVSTSQAVWTQWLGKVNVGGDKRGDYTVESNILGKVPKPGGDLTSYSLMLRTAKFGQAYIIKKQHEEGMETLTITLTETENPGQVAAEYDHVVYRGDKILVRFSGTTRLFVNPP